MTDENENKQYTRIWIPHIPQLYHDIIARLIPGAVMVCMFVLTAAGPKQISNILKAWPYKSHLKYPPTTVTVIVFFVLSYILSTVLWGIWFRLSSLKNRKRTDIDFATGISDKHGNLNIMYEFIKQKNPTAGDRITKLKGQIYMSQVLIVGFFLSLLMNFVLILWTWKNNSLDSLRITLAIFQFVAIVGSEGAKRHFVHHTKAEIENNARLLKYKKTRELILLLDFDGTLADLDKFKAYEGLVEKYAESNNPNLAHTLYEEDIELCKKGMYDRTEVFRKHPEQFPEVCVERLCLDFWEEATRTQRLKENCRDILKKLKAHGHMLVCATDADGRGGNKFRRIAATGLANYFERIYIGSENVPFEKGCVEYLNWIIDELGVQRSQCVMIGDKVGIDLEPAKKNGMFSILIENEEYPGDWTVKIKSLSEIITIIERLT